MSLGVLVLGVLNGLSIGLLSAGFVLVYRSNKFLNLAHAQLGALPSLLVAKWVNDQGWPFLLALVVALAIGLATGVAVERFLVRPVRRRTAAPVRLLMLTIGIAQTLLALTFIPAFTPDRSLAKPYPQPFDAHWRIGGVDLAGMSILALFLVPALLAALTYFLGYTLTGRQIRAAANNPEAARLCGISPDRVGQITWAIAGVLSAVSGVLNGPSSASAISPAAVGPQLLLFTMGASAFGAFASIPLAIGGGVALGVAYQVVLAETLRAGTALVVVFGLIIAVILIRGDAIGKVFKASGAAIPERPAVRIPVEIKDEFLVKHGGRLLGVGSLALAALLPLLPGLNSESNRFLLVLIVVYALVGMSATMLIGWGGQVSLGHFALVGLGAYLTAHWAAAGWSLLTIILVCGLVGALASAAIGLPAVRVPGLTLAVTTLGLAVLAPEWLFLQKSIGGDTPFTTPVARPDISPQIGMPTSQAHVYYLALITLVLLFLAAAALRRSSAGRVILAVRDNERASAAFGLTPTTVKLTLLALCGFMACVAGVFWALAWQRVSPVQFGPDTSAAILAIPVVGGLGSLGGALAAAAFLFLNTFFVGPHLSFLFGSLGHNIAFLLFLGGITTVVTMMQFPNGIAGVVQDRWQRYLDDRARQLRERDTTYVDTPLIVTDVALRFGGIVALDGASIEVRRGEIVGLIGPNGAGKTTLMNVVSGVLRADRGSVRVFGAEIADLPADLRAGFGLARSFQDASLFAGLTVVETIQIALGKGSKTGVLSAMLSAPWVRAADHASRTRAEQIMATFGLTEYADTMASALSTGTRRICDLAAQVAANPRLLLLDEPTGGVAQREAEAFGPLVRKIRDDLDCAILIIEHDMPLLMDLCDRVYAMELGRVIADGTPNEVRNDPQVVASYLGTDDVAIGRSGGNKATASPNKKATAARKRPPAKPLERTRTAPGTRKGSA